MSISSKSILALAMAVSFASNAADRPDIDSFLPNGALVASVLGVVADPKSEEISSRVALAAKENQEWFREYVAVHRDLKPGELLPYHKNLGVSEDEYRYFVEHASKASRISEIAKVPLAVTATADVVKIEVGIEQSIFKLVRVDLKNGIVSTELGDIENPEYVAPEQRESLIGKWGGYTWNREEGNPLSPSGEAKKLSVTYGAIQGTQSKFIHYRANVIRQGEMIVAEDIYLRVDDAHNNSLEARRP